MVQPIGPDEDPTPERPAPLSLAAAVLRAVRDVDIKVADRVLVSGSGLVADLAEQAARFFGGRVTKTLLAEEGPSRGDCGRPGVTGEFDVLIETTADPAVWPRGLGLLHDRGRALLLLPPGPQVHPFDFYPAVHRRSLSVLARRLPEMNGWSDADPDAIRAAERLIQHSFLRTGGTPAGDHVVPPAQRDGATGRGR